MTVSAGNAGSNIKRDSVATGNSMVISELIAGDDLVQSIISNEFIEDDILIDSNNNVKIIFKILN